MFVTCLPLYLVAEFDFDIKLIGMFGWMPYVGAAAGSLCGGWLAKQLFARDWSINQTRKFTITLGGAIMLPSLIGTAYASEPSVAIFLIAVILFGFQLAIGNIQTLPSDFFSGKSVGSLAGIGGTAAVVGVLITTNVVPILTEVSWIPFFLLGALIVPLAIASVWMFGGHIQPLRPPSEDE